MGNHIIFENTLLRSLGITSKLAGYYFIDIFHENGIELSKEQWIVLKKLFDKDGQSQNDLAFITKRSKTSLTRLINTMEKKELVTRKISKEDKRINHIYLSKKGKAILLKSLPILKNMMDELQKNICENDIKIAIDVLNRLQDNIHKKLKIN